ncbi:hypothetical protein DP42_3893 [Burkholderia pseudomallei]|nr:hypothetical protein DP42_3893 [Burkholderia pseudomallei]
MVTPARDRYLWAITWANSRKNGNCEAGVNWLSHVSTWAGVGTTISAVRYELIVFATAASRSSRSLMVFPGWFVFVTPCRTFPYRRETPFI